MEYLDKLKLKREKTDIPRDKITGSKSAYEYVKQFYGDDIDVEVSLFILLLNSDSKPIGFAKVGQGGVNRCDFDNRIICNYAINTLCTSLILVHNSPSGILRSSSQDVSSTKSLIKTLDLFKITLHDHLIITSDGYFSMADEGEV